MHSTTSGPLSRRSRCHHCIATTGLLSLLVWPVSCVDDDAPRRAHVAGGEDIVVDVDHPGFSPGLVDTATPPRRAAVDVRPAFGSPHRIAQQPDCVGWCPESREPACDDLLVIEPQLVELSGTVVTSDQTSLPWSAFVVARDVVTGAAYFAPVEGDEYVLQVLVGEYDVGLTTSSSLRPDEAFDLAFETLALDQSMDRHWTVPVARLEGLITTNGQTPAPSEGFGRVSRGHVRLLNRATMRTYYANVSSHGEARFEAVVPAGEYVLTWQTSHQQEFDGVLEAIDTTLPEGETALATISMPEGEHMQAFDTRVVHITGEVLREGTSLPDDDILDGHVRGVVIFRQLDGSGFQAASLGEVGAGRYETWLFAGRYQIDVVANDSERQTALPQNPVASPSSRDLYTDLELTIHAMASPEDIEPETARYHGSVAVAGHPDGYRPEWMLMLTDPSGGWVRVPVADDGTFEADITPARYTIWLTSRHPGVVGGATLLGSCMALAGQDEEQHFDVELKHVLGEVRVNGAALADNTFPDPRALIQISHEPTGRSGTIEIGPTGPGTFEAWLLPGSYEVVMDSHITSRGFVIYEQDVLPRGKRDLGSLEVVEDRTFFVNLDVFSVSGELSMDRVSSEIDTVPHENNPFGLQFVHRGDGSVFFVPSSLEGGSFDVLLYGGSYDIELGFREWPQGPFANTSVAPRSWCGLSGFEL